MKSDQDAELIREISKGGEAGRQAIGSLFRTYNLPLVRRFRRMTGNASDAADLAQGVFLKVIKAAPKFKGQCPVKLWLWKIAGTHLIDYYRERGRTPPIDDLDEWAERVSEQPSERDELIACVHQGLQRFALEHPERAEAVRLTALEGWSLKEVASWCGRTVNATKEYVSQCRRALTPFIAHCRDYVVPSSEGGPLL